MNQKLPSRTIAWASDTHFNLSTERRIRKFCQEIICEDDCEALIITGDIAESDSIVKHLLAVQKEIKIPIYFVLGNHDFYNSTISNVTNDLLAHNLSSSNIHWLTTIDYIPISDTVALVGNENWWDGRAGSLESLGLLDGIIMAPDYLLIGDIKFKNKEDRFAKLRELADECTKRILQKLSMTFLGYKEVILCVHVPPFEESCEYNEKRMTRNLLPHYTHKALGNALIDFMSVLHKDKKLTVLAGHTHESTVFKPLKNLVVKVAKANYFKPKVHKFIKLV